MPKQPYSQKSCSQLSSKTIKMISFSCHSQSIRGIYHSHRPLCTVRICDKLTIKITTITMQQMQFNLSIEEVCRSRKARNRRLPKVKWISRISLTKINSLIRLLCSLTRLIKYVTTVQIMVARQSILAPFSKCNRTIVNSSKIKSNPICRKQGRTRSIS